MEFGNLPWQLPNETAHILVRIVQEGMTNAFNHGRATRIDIYFWRMDGDIVVTIHDNGRGSSIWSKGLV